MVSLRWLGLLAGLILGAPTTSFSQGVPVDDPFASGAANEGAINDPFAPDEEAEMDKLFTELGGKETVTLLLRTEVYELPAVKAIRLMDEELSGQKLREHLLKMLENGDSTLASLHAVRFESGFSAVVESLVEDIYPTEYDPPEALPAGSPLLRPDQKLTPTQRQQKVALSFASPSAFETKNLGVTLEAEAGEVTVAEEGWNLLFALAEVSRLEEKSWVEGTVTMPVFKVNSTKAMLRVKEGVWTMTTCQPPVDGKGRPDLSRVRMILIKLKQVEN